MGFELHSTDSCRSKKFRSNSINPERASAGRSGGPGSVNVSRVSGVLSNLHALTNIGWNERIQLQGVLGTRWLPVTFYSSEPRRLDRRFQDQDDDTKIGGWNRETRRQTRMKYLSHERCPPVGRFSFRRGQIHLVAGARVGPVRINHAIRP